MSAISRRWSESSTWMRWFRLDVALARAVGGDAERERVALVEGLDRVADRRSVLLGARGRSLSLLGLPLVAFVHRIDVHVHRPGLKSRSRPAGYPRPAERSRRHA